MTELDLSRWQFAFTVIFHMIFPALTVGLAVFLCVIYGMYWRNGNPVLLQMFRFWKRIFAVAFGLGVVAGTTLSFEFGLNWGRYAAATGPVLAPIIAMEVVTAFFLEAGFIGIMLLGDGRVKQRTMFTATLFVAIGTILSSSWIISANSWMQTPAGYDLVDGQFVPRDWIQVIFNPSFGWRWPHLVLAVLIASMVFVAGISSYYLVRGRALRFAGRSFSIALGVIGVLIPLQLQVGNNVSAHEVGLYQPTKVQAYEGNWDSTNTGWVAFVIPDMENERNLVQISVPLLGSWYDSDFTGKSTTPGLLETPKDLRPNMWPTFWGFHAMFYAGSWIFVLAAIGLVLRIRGRLLSTRWFHKLVLYSTPLGVVAIIGGWVVAETGRQPWIVYGQLRTADAVSELATPELVVSVCGFMVVYLSLFVIFIAYVVRAVRRGPERDDPEIEEGPTEKLSSAEATGVRS